MDAIHRASGKKQESNPLERIIDLFNNRTPQELDALGKPLPITRIPLKMSNLPEQQQRTRADVIANNLKLIQLKSLISEY